MHVLAYGLLLFCALLRAIVLLLERIITVAIQCQSDLLFFASLLAIMLVLLSIVLLTAENIPMPSVAHQPAFAVST